MVLEFLRVLATAHWIFPELERKSVLRIHCLHDPLVFLAKEVTGEIGWLELEPMHVAAKVTLFHGLSLQEKDIFISFSYDVSVWRNRVRRTDRRIFALMYTERCTVLSRI
jgi:hypothetical protein